MNTTTRMRAFGTQRIDPERDPVRDRTGLRELSHVRDTLRRRYGDGMNCLVRFFASADENGDGILTTEELFRGLEDLGVTMGHREWAALSAEFDPNGDGVVSESEFLSAIVGQMNLKRKAQVVEAFAHVAGSNGNNNNAVAPATASAASAFNADNGSGSNAEGVIVDRSMSVPLAVIVDVYDPSGHPDVVKGIRTPLEMKKGLVDTFAVIGDGDAVITRDEFIEYHANMSCGIFDEAGFTRFIRTAWGIDKAIKERERNAKYGVIDDPANPYLARTGYGNSMPRS